ncbi:MAG: ROK family protein [Clostridia bacterium]
MKNIGLDIGGTSIKGAVVEDGKIIKSVKVATNAKLGLDAILQAIFDCIDMLLPFVDSNSKIGIGSAGDINPFSGEVIYATENLPNFTGLRLKEIVEKKFNREVTVINDAISGLIGELKYGAGVGASDVVMLTLGTGLGFGAVIGGKLLLGQNCRAGRFGHITLYPNGRDCTCGKFGCAEQYVSATGLLRTAKKIGLDQNDCTEIMRLSTVHNKLAEASVDKFLSDLVLLVTDIENLFDPERLIIGGGLVESREYWWDNFLSRLTEHQKAVVVPAKLGNKAGFFGSQYIAFDKSLFDK